LGVGFPLLGRAAVLNTLCVRLLPGLIEEFSQAGAGHGHDALTFEGGIPGGVEFPEFFFVHGEEGKRLMISNHAGAFALRNSNCSPMTRRRVLILPVFLSSHFSMRREPSM